MRFNHTILFAISLLFIVSACEEPIDLDLPENEPELVIEGYYADLDFDIPDEDLDCSGLTVPLGDIKLAASLAALFPFDSVENEANFFPYNKVTLTTTENYFSNGAPPAVTDAIVFLYENDVAVEQLMHDASEPGAYRITHDPVVGAVYHLEIQWEGTDYVTDPEEYKAVPPLLEVGAYWRSNFIGDTCAYYLGINTYESQGVGDRYRWFFYENNEYVDSPFFISTFEDTEIDGLCLFEFDVYGDELQLGDTIVVFQMKTSEGYYDYINSVQTQTAFVGSPFDTPPAPIRGNLRYKSEDKRAHGYFAVGGISANAVVVPDEIVEGGCE